jgi:beta-glucanase (GH16 family)
MLSLFARYGWLPAAAAAVAGALVVGLQGRAAAKPCRPIFADEFISRTLNTRRWNVEYKSGRTELQYYAPDALELWGGVLRIRAERRPQKGYDYTSGIITTKGTFSQMYGYFEMRAKVPSGQGLWPAFWLLHTGVLPWMEIDVVEVLGHEPNRLHLSHHWRDAANEHAGASVKFVGPDYSKAFHTYAVDWRPGKLEWYVDGVLRAEADEHVPAEPMFLLANLAVGGDWPGAPDETTEFPAYLEIDYIRVYAPGCRPPTRSAPAGAKPM